MRKVLILICLLISSNIANAADWVEIAYKTYVDLNSYKKDGVYASAWFKSLNPGDWELMSGKKVWYSVSLIKANCTSKTIRILTTVDYDLKGKVIDDTFVGIESRSFSVMPDTVGETKYNALCN